MKPESALMLARAREALRGAALLQASATDLSGVVSRAYYAAFHAASAVLTERGLNARTHRGVHGLFYAEVARPGLLPVEMAKVLTDLFEQRLGADYETGVVFSEEAAARAVAQARDFVEAAERFLA